MHSLRRLVRVGVGIVCLSTVTTAVASKSGFHMLSSPYARNDAGKSISNGQDISVSSRLLLQGYKRVDDKLLSEQMKQYRINHALHDTLNGENKISAYEVYHKENDEEIVVRIKFGNTLNGHPGVVHGGITALVIDNTYGWLFFILKQPVAFTANLSINYRAPLFENTEAILRAKMVKVEGRKMYMSAVLEDTKGKVIADSTTLFIKPKDWRESFVSAIYRFFNKS